MDNSLEMLEESPLARYIPNQMEVEKICDEYQVGKLVNIDGELGGLFNVNLKITTTSGKYVIRVHSGLSSKNHINAQKVVLRKLKRERIPLNTKTGSYVSKLHNRFVQLTPFVKGIPFQFSKEQAYQCGSILRKFHDTLMDEKEIPAPFWSNYPSCEVLKQGIDRLKEQQRELHEPSLIKEVEKLYQIVMEQWLPKANSLTKVIIHADWHPWNVLFDNNNKVKCILDFDFLQKGERIHDISYFLWAIRNAENSEELALFKRVWANFIC